MRSWFSDTPGGIETLELRDSPTPEPEPGDVLIRVKATAGNFFDTLIIQDRYQVKPPRPFAPGGEVAGIVEAVGATVTAFQPGDRVAAYPGYGGYAELVVCPTYKTFKIPDETPFDAAACLLITYGTSYYALQDRGALKAGETLLVMGAAGGTGASAIELGKVAGARVIAAVSSQEKADFCHAIGADETLIYGRDLDKDAQKALSQQIKTLSGGGVDVVYDAIGGPYAEPALRTLNWGGRYLVIGFAAGIPSMPLNLTLLKGCEIIGVHWGAFADKQRERLRVVVEELMRLHAKGVICPRIGQRFAFEDLPEALKTIENRSAQGKLVVMGAS